VLEVLEVAAAAAVARGRPRTTVARVVSVVVARSSSSLGDVMDCRIGCGACCIVLRIDEPYPNHPDGKARGERCRNLDAANACSIYADRPASCRSFTPSLVMCGDDREEALELLPRFNEAFDSGARSELIDRARGAVA